MPDEGYKLPSSSDSEPQLPAEHQTRFDRLMSVDPSLWPESLLDFIADETDIDAADIDSAPEKLKGPVAEWLKQPQSLDVVDSM